MTKSEMTKREAPANHANRRERRVFLGFGVPWLPFNAAALDCDLAIGRFRPRFWNFLTSCAKPFNVKLDRIVHFTFDFRACRRRGNTTGNIRRVC